MKRVAISLSVLVLLLAVGVRSASAGSILYFTDASNGPNRMAQALASATITGAHTVTTAASLAAFTASVSGGAYDLVIFQQQSSSGPAYDAAWAAVAAHIIAGGSAIGADWSVVINESHLPAFGADYVGGTNQASFTVSGASLLPGVTNPVALTNPGWTTFSYNLAPLGGASCFASFAGGQCAIVGANGGRTFMNGFLGDTIVDETEGVNLYINEIQASLGATAVPEPGTVVLIGLGLVGLAAGRRRLNKQ